MARDPYRRRIALDLVEKRSDASGLTLPAPRVGGRCVGSFRVGREIVPAKILTIDRDGLRCAAEARFPPATFVVLELDGRAVGVGPFEITGIVARSQGHEHEVQFYAADIVARERLQVLLVALRLHEDELEATNATRIISGLLTSHDEVSALKAMVTQMAFERYEARRALAEERANHAATQARLDGLLADAASEAAWLPDADSAPSALGGVSQVMMAALQDDIGAERSPAPPKRSSTTAKRSSASPKRSSAAGKRPAPTEPLPVPALAGRGD